MRRVTIIVGLILYFGSIVLMGLLTLHVAPHYSIVPIQVLLPCLIGLVVVPIYGLKLALHFRSPTPTALQAPLFTIERLELPPDTNGDSS